MSTNNGAVQSQTLPPIPEDVLNDSESRLRQGKGNRDATKRRIAAKDYQSLDTPARLRARIGRVMGDPVAASEASRTAGNEFESLGVSEVPDTLLERIISGENFVGVRFFDLGQRAARAIVRVDIRTDDGRSGTGTGSLVSSRLLLTNNHVLASVGWARGSSVVFDFEDDLDNKPRPTVVFGLDPDTFFFTSKDFDFTLVAVNNNSLHPQGVSLRSYGFIPLDGAEGKVAVGEPINIIQHPSGLLKQVVLQENRLLDLTDNPPGWLHYESDTQPGSSGAPLFNNRWEMVGLHHSGWPERDSEGRILTVDGKVWTREMGELAVKWLGNEGARVSQILRSVTASRDSMDSKQQALVDELVNPVKAGSVVIPSESTNVPTTNEQTVPTETKSSDLSRSQSSGVTITVPLHITFSVGAPASGEPSMGQPEPPKLPDLDRISFPGSSVETDNTEHVDALRELAAANTLPYYDAAADQARREDYYRDVNLNDTPTNLFNSLGSLLASTHQQRLPYKPARHLYPWVDLQPDGKLHSLYTTDVYQAQELIAESFMIEARFESMLESMLLSDEGAGALPLLEAGPAYNCEHVVPRSWFHGPQFSVAEGDLHHLFTCHQGCNSFRGNVPYWDFLDANEATMQGCGQREENKFEPAHGKGPAARAVMYFLLRYPGLVDNIASEFQAARIQTLINWHQQVPVSDYERHRNAAIGQKQGNRNPLIDFPELAGRINFVLGLTTS